MKTYSRPWVYFLAKCSPFAGRPHKAYTIRVDIEHGFVCVWDTIAHHYTHCHSLSQRTVGRFLRRGLTIAEHFQN